MGVIVAHLGKGDGTSSRHSGGPFVIRQENVRVPRRSEDVIPQTVGDDFVVLDADGCLHALTGPAANVWRAT